MAGLVLQRLAELGRHPLRAQLGRPLQQPAEVVGAQGLDAEIGQDRLLALGLDERAAVSVHGELSSWGAPARASALAA